MSKKTTIVTNPSRKSWLYGFFKERHEPLSSLTPEEKRRLLEGDWDYDDDKDVVMVTGRPAQGKSYMAIRGIFETVKPPYRYEIMPDRHLVIIGRDNGRMLYICPDIERMFTIIRELEKLS